MATMGKFGEGMDTAARSVLQGASVYKRRLALAVDQAVVMATPVKTGRARANWFVVLGGRSPPAEIDPGSPQSAAQEAIQRGILALGEEDDLDAPIHIVNNLPYIIPLNEGHSPQAPAGFIEQAIDYAVAAVRKPDITVPSADTLFKVDLGPSRGR